MRLRTLFFGVLLGWMPFAWGQGEPALFWPTPNDAFYKGKGVESFIQPTAGNTVSSGLFGSVRNGGYRFHEGLDMKAVQRNRRGNVSDAIYAALPGTISYINRLAGNSGYGNYVVLEHNFNGLSLYTLYAHLASVQRELVAGQRVEAGAKLGIMGRTAGGYTIGLAQTHLHFEIGVRLTDNASFQNWYAWKKYTTANHHGPYNGMNLVGMNALELFEKMRDKTFEGYRRHLEKIPPAFALRVYTNKVPEFIRRNPALLKKQIPANLAAWDIEFTWYAMPLSFTPRSVTEVHARRAGDVRVLGYDKQLIQSEKSRSTLIFNGENISYGKNLLDNLNLLFNFRY